MQLGDALVMLRMILGDESESIWSNAEIYQAINLSNKRIMARLVAMDPDAYVITYEKMCAGYADNDVAPLQYHSAAGTGTDGMYLFANMAGLFVTEGITVSKFTVNILGIKRLFYSRESGLTNLIEIPIVPFSALEEVSEVDNLEYEVMSNTRVRSGRYKAAYSHGSDMLWIRPRPTKVLYLKAYIINAGTHHIDTTSADDHLLLFPWDGSVNEKAFLYRNTQKGEAVVYDAAYTLSFKDASLREAFASERERIIGTQPVSSGPSEAY